MHTLNTVVIWGVVWGLLNLPFSIQDIQLKCGVHLHKIKTYLQYFVCIEPTLLNKEPKIINRMILIQLSEQRYPGWNQDQVSEVPFSCCLDDSTGASNILFHN